MLTGVCVTGAVEVDVRTTGLLPGTAVQELVAVTAEITNLPAAEAGSVS